MVTLNSQGAEDWQGPEAKPWGTPSRCRQQRGGSCLQKIFGDEEETQRETFWHLGMQKPWGDRRRGLQGMWVTSRPALQI